MTPDFQTPFQRNTLEGEDRQDTFTIKLNAEERALLEKIKDALHEDKDGTALKQAAFQAGAKVLFDPLTHALIDLGVANFKRGKRSGRIRDIDV